MLIITNKIRKELIGRGWEPPKKSGPYTIGDIFEVEDFYVVLLQVDCFCVAAFRCNYEGHLLSANRHYKPVQVLRSDHISKDEVYRILDDQPPRFVRSLPNVGA